MLENILMWRYPASGYSMLNDDKHKLNSYWTSNIKKLLHAKSHTNTSLKLSVLESRFNYIIQAAPDNLTVLSSGGIDSTYIAVLAQSLGKKINLINITYLDYDESDKVENLANILGVKASYIHLTEDAIDNSFRNICKWMPAPNERGSTILSYFLYNTKANLLIGDAFDCCFSPSMPETIAASKKETISEQEFNNLLYKLTPLEFKRITGKQPPRIKIDCKECLQDPLTLAIFFDYISDTPYYYRLRYKNTNVTAPAQDLHIAEYSLSCKSLHQTSEKYYLRMIANKLFTQQGLPKSDQLAATPKGLMKIEPEMYSFLDKYIDPNYLPPNINLTQVNKLPQHKKAWTNLLLAITSQWLASRKITGEEYARQLRHTKRKNTFNLLQL